ncbi:proline dehydrogenase family protein [Chitinophaga varians]|uniref:proline dehydrogenase family protein n=1 Tax=Chitinophaga varians TaxID=2202339 RepID=UPI00165FF0CE|nr:proline dehydrogenase family protein [Chitinophaga varians]MBC9909750.1 proline dehydrogenase family protein [Chitinophaga varians]
MDKLLSIGSAALKKAALNEQAKEFILENEVLFNVLKKAADRYIGGETLEETLTKVIQQNQLGFKCSVEFMGESTRNEQEAMLATNEFIRICQEISNGKLYSTVSLDLSHIGLAVSEDLCFNNLMAICSEAARSGTEVIISAEGTERTDAIMNTYKRAVKEYNGVGITMQAYLYRSKDDFKELIKEPGRIRIVKGAFETAPGVSMPRGAQLDEAYLGYVGQLLSEGHLCSIATHHHEVQQQAKTLVQQYNPDKDKYEFESLYGIQTEQLEKLKEEGYPAKLYFVYGKEWYLYLCNRLAEYPLNIFRALNDIVS